MGMANESVVMLEVRSPSGKGMSASGFAYDKDRIITAGHFCISALEIQIFESHTEDIHMKYYDDDGETKKTEGLVVDDFSRTEDLCMLKKVNHGIPPLPVVSDYSKVRKRDIVTVIGAPNSVAVGEFEGRVMLPYYKGSSSITVKNKLVVSSPSTGGVSGSPIILNRTGEVIGVMVRSHRYFDHLSFGVNGEDLIKFVNGVK